MQFDVPRQLGAITRVVSGREREGRPVKVIVATRVYDTAADDVWDAITSPRRIPRWFLPITGELRIGGRYQLEGNAGGEVLSCDRPRHLAITWEMRGDVSWVDVRLTETAGRTELVLEHTAHVPDEWWDQYGPGAVGVGWDLTLVGLDAHLSTGATVDPAEAAAWSASPEGIAFIQGSSAAWGRASVGGGTPEVAARAAAERTTAFYTGQA